MIKDAIKYVRELGKESGPSYVVRNVGPERRLIKHDGTWEEWPRLLGAARIAELDAVGEFCKHFESGVIAYTHERVCVAVGVSADNPHANTAVLDLDRHREREWLECESFRPPDEIARFIRRNPEMFGERWQEILTTFEHVNFERGNEQTATAERMARSNYAEEALAKAIGSGKRPTQLPPLTLYPKLIQDAFDAQEPFPVDVWIECDPTAGRYAIGGLNDWTTSANENARLQVGVELSKQTESLPGWTYFAGTHPADPDLS